MKQKRKQLDPNKRKPTTQAANCKKILDLRFGHFPICDSKIWLDEFQISLISVKSIEWFMRRVCNGECPPLIVSFAAHDPASKSMMIWNEAHAQYLFNTQNEGYRFSDHGKAYDLQSIKEPAANVTAFRGKGSRIKSIKTITNTTPLIEPFLLRQMTQSQFN